jgi:hypothetical protein
VAGVDPAYGFNQFPATRLHVVFRSDRERFEVFLRADDVLQSGTKLSGKTTVCDDYDADHAKLLILCHECRPKRSPKAAHDGSGLPAGQGESDASGASRPRKGQSQLDRGGILERRQAHQGELDSKNIGRDALFRQALYLGGLHQIDNQDQFRACHRAGADDAYAAHFHLAGDILRGAGDDAAIFAPNDHLVVGDEAGRVLRDGTTPGQEKEAQRQVRLACAGCAAQKRSMPAKGHTGAM